MAVEDNATGRGVELYVFSWSQSLQACSAHPKGNKDSHQKKFYWGLGMPIGNYR